MTIAVLRALHAILGDALDDIERIYSPPKTFEDTSDISDEKLTYASPPPSPFIAPVDFPSLDATYDPNDPAEQLTSHPVVVQAINRIVAAAGQMAATVQAPFYSLCDASMGYHLPSCMRLLEASHTVELLREAGPNGLHVDLISQRNMVDSNKLAHILRLLATHHFLREIAPNIFTINRISSLMDSGKSFDQLKQWEKEGRLELKYQDSNGISAFVGTCSDELFKSSAYLTEACLRNDSSRPPFGHAFDTDVEFFPWLEGEGGEDGSRIVNKDKLRVERFGKAMSGSGSWEAPGAIFEGFDWRSLPRGSTIVDVGGGIGSSSMMLANAYCQPNGGKSMDSPLHAFLESPGQQREESDEDLGFKFIIQDRPIVVEMGEKAWRAKCPELLDSGIAIFQEHDFFTEQPIRNAAVFFLRVILHDWPDSSARAILLRLREAAKPETKLVLAEFVLPLACVDADEVAADDPAVTGVLNGVEGAESTLAPAPLLANLGKASANAYWMDLTMQVTFNAQERTLRETTALAQSAGWKVVKVTRSPGSLFGHIVAVPAPIPPQYRTTPDLSPTVSNTSLPIKVTRSHNPSSNRSKADFYDLERTRSESRCGTPTFGSRTALPSMQESMGRFGGLNLRSRVPGLSSKPRSSSTRATGQSASSSTRSSLGQNNQNPSNSPVHVKKKPSPLALVTSKSNITSPIPSPRLASPQPAMKRRFSLAQLRSLPPKQAPGSPAPIMRDHETPPSPITPKYPSFTTQRSLPRRASNAQLTLTHIPTRSLTGVIPPSPLSPLLPPLPSATSPLPSESRSIPTSPSPRKLSRPKSLAHLYQSAQSQESGSKPPTPVPPVPPLRPSALSPSTSTSHSPYDPPPRVPPPRLGPIPRRASQAPAPQSNSLRKRSGTVISPPLGAGVGVGGAVSMISSLLQPDTVRGSGGGSLNFGDVSNGKMKQKERSDAEPNDLGKMMTLAAAAHIE